MDRSAQGWADATSLDEVERRASGRRHYNSVRQARAQARRVIVLKLLGALGFRYGIQAVIARRLQVSESTISRDLTAVLGHPPARCPFCGCACAELDRLEGLL